ncbi:MAG: enoyl-CoA hydratase/isomerase family protein [Burkholderiaceae bacterium]|nr:enoyl-CoA hydratase/isomerase family protein [Burkholderiaceae bacterium]
MVTTQKAGRIAILTLNRPKALNALDTQAWTELGNAVQLVLADADIRACVLTGSGGRAFSAGADRKELTGRTIEGLLEHAQRVHKILACIEASPKPFVAAINGLAVGGGAEIALACHLRVAADNARLSFPEVQMGLIPGAGGTQRLARILGKGRAMELVLSGRRLYAQEALHWGLLNEVAPAAELPAASQRIAECVLGGSPYAAALGIRALNAAYESDSGTGSQLEIALLGLSFGLGQQHAATDGKD